MRRIPPTHPCAPLAALLTALVLFAASPVGRAIHLDAMQAQQYRRVTPSSKLERLPNFDLKNTLGEDVSSEQLRGKVLLIDFWATWCAPCRKEMPGYQELQRKYGKRGFSVIGIALDSDASRVVSFARNLGVSYTILLDPEIMSSEDESKKWGLQGIPTTLLVDRDGVVRFKVVGFEHTGVIEQALKNLLDP